MLPWMVVPVLAERIDVDAADAGGQHVVDHGGAGGAGGDDDAGAALPSVRFCAHELVSLAPSRITPCWGPSTWLRAIVPPVAEARSTDAATPHDGVGDGADCVSPSTIPRSAERERP